MTGKRKSSSSSSATTLPTGGKRKVLCGHSESLQKEKPDSAKPNKSKILDLASMMHIEERLENPSVGPAVLLRAAETAVGKAQQERSLVASKAGKAPKSKSEDLTARNSQIQAAAAKLLAGGTAARNLGGILATRFNLTPRQVNRILSAQIERKADT